MEWIEILSLFVNGKCQRVLLEYLLIIQLNKVFIGKEKKLIF